MEVQCVVRERCVGPCVFDWFLKGRTWFLCAAGGVCVKDSTGESSCSQSYDGHGGRRTLCSFD